ncbi:MAG: ECF RNA polymerase sigma factor SigK [Nitriliruptorales bacterium]|nr:ECF RNA polymerase sigma factor SigK [Nitriliruptorales bacterium]
MSPDPHRQARLRTVGAGSEEPVSDEELLREIAKGSREAFEALYDRYDGQVYGVVRKVLRDPARSEETTQEIFTEIWRTATNFDPDRGSGSTWIFTMAHRRAIDRVRSVQASRDRDERVGHRDRVRPFDQVSEEVETRIEHRQVREGLEQLTDLQREAVELAYYGGHTYREVAELLGAPLGTVKTRIRDGLIRLRDALGVTA